MAPTIRPPAPRPWSARKAISWSMFCDRPVSAEPIRKTTMATMNIALRPCRSPSLPQTGVVTAAPRA